MKKLLFSPLLTKQTINCQLEKAVDINTLLTKIRKIDRKRQQALKRLGLVTVRDLLFYFPKRYNDFSTITSIKKLQLNEQATIRGQIKAINTSRTPRRRLVITEAVISDDSASLKIVWFNQPYIERSLPVGTCAVLHGKVESGYQAKWQLTNPVFERYKEDSVHTGRIVPVYAETAGLTSRWLRFVIKPLLSKVGEIKDWLPEEIIEKQGLISLAAAIKQIHFPDNTKSLCAARKRLSFDELFLIQLNSLQKKAVWQQNKSYAVKFDEPLVKKFVGQLPFILTKAQKIAAWEILQDLEKSEPMNRLLEGDVGSGKTVVAAISALQVVKAGYQVALMVPTEILAGQHFTGVSKLLQPFGVKVGLFTRSNIKTSINGTHISKSGMGKLIKAGKLDLVIGTHALIQDKVKFKKLALAIVDEQHRFGVEQRAKLKKIDQQPQTAPHLLSLTATPIPRTLALGLYGDLDLSIIGELPPGRQKIITKLVAPYNRDKAYNFIRQKVSDGRQVFVVCPLIEESDKLGVKSATEEYNKLSRQVFPELAIGLLHGRLPKEEKEQVMGEFVAGKLNILVSTSVIEVGIDVPNAIIMMIEGAERFGLAQLHQFRGRVGRGEQQSYCFLFTEAGGEKVQERLQAIVDCHDGFKLAEKDLEIRGPGEVYGLQQSGLPDLRMASLTDYGLIKQAKQAADKLLDKDPDLDENVLLRERIGQFEKVMHWE
ncbi:ATP-dependent DNA helicase RecG [Patescibacteria group bacterium]|nr:ATP-dependent DNA helicase RecG [Patescibacteria group bacterium]